MRQIECAYSKCDFETRNRFSSRKSRQAAACRFSAILRTTAATLPLVGIAEVFLCAQYFRARHYKNRAHSPLSLRAEGFRQIEGACKKCDFCARKIKIKKALTEKRGFRTRSKIIENFLPCHPERKGNAVALYPNGSE